ncbi:MAG TPA: hypothetical protein VIX11_12870 [Candidatus Acidoferrum sp.]
MNRRLVMSLILGGTLPVSAALVRAQEAPALPPRGEMLRGGGPGRDFMPPPMGDRVELMGFEGMRGGKIVTGAPFSGVAVTESTQTLGDGNHITHKTQANVFRDSQGRVRKEVTLSGFGPMAASGGAKSFVVISDPVAKANFVLHPDTKVAEQMDDSRREMKWMAKGGAFQEKIQARQEAEIAAGNLKKEDLGTQVIGGVSTQGTRLTRTIPAGQIGNEKPILIVHETWFSNDLQMVVMSKRSNPWGGDTTYTLTNIQRTEPAAALFTVPSDFTVKQGGPGKHGMGKFKQGAPPPPPPEN